MAGSASGEQNQTTISSRSPSDVEIHLTSKRVNQALTDTQWVKLLAKMRQIVFRGLGGILGFFTAIVALTGPILFIFNSLNEADSIRQNGGHGGHFSLTGAVGGSLTVLVVAALFAFLAFTLLRFAFRGPKNT
jgi:hypothetical protein